MFWTFRKAIVHVCQSARALSALREAFDMFDKDKNGQISEDELMCVMSSLGIKPTLQEVKDIINEFDIDSKRTRTLAQFTWYMYDCATCRQPAYWVWRVLSDDGATNAGHTTQRDRRTHVCLPSTFPFQSCVCAFQLNGFPSTHDDGFTVIRWNFHILTTTVATIHVHLLTGNTGMFVL